MIDEKPWEATWPRGEPPSELESGGNIYLDKEGRRKQCKVRKPREGVVMSGYGPGNAPSKCIPSGHIWKGKSHFQKPGPGRKKKSYSFPDGMWNFAVDLLDFFPNPELPK